MSDTQTNLTVLVVEDDPDLVLVMRHELTLAGHRVLVAETAEAALSQAAEADLVLLDFHLPGTDGLNVMEQIQKLRRPPSIVMVTGDDLGGLDQEALRAGAIDFVPKRPGYLRALPGIVQRAARQHDLSRRVDDFEAVALGLLASEAPREAVAEIVHGACRMLHADRAALLNINEDGRADLGGMTQVGGAQSLAEAVAAMPLSEMPGPGEAFALDDDALVVRLASGSGEGWLLAIGGVNDVMSRDERMLAQAYGRVATSALQAIDRRRSQVSLVDALQKAADGRTQADTAAKSSVVDRLRRASEELAALLDGGTLTTDAVRAVARAEAHVSAAIDGVTELVAPDPEG